MPVPSGDARTVRASDRGLLMHRLALRVREHLPSQGRGRILLVSSARPGEGKSVMARALAKRLVQQHRGRVLLIDGSAEAPAGHAGSRARGRNGFFDLLREPGISASAVVSRSEGRLHLLGSGQSRDASLVYHESAVSDLFGKLRERYHWTIVDAGTLPQIGCLGAQADGVLLVVDAQSTRREVVRGALDIARLPVGRLLGAVLNRRPQYVPAWAYRSWL
jgi:Mrp family chromosome partitioning ATPase